MPASKTIKIQYNAPVILTFSLLAIGIHLLNMLIPNLTIQYFALRPSMSLLNPLDYFRLFSHVLGHSTWGHLFGNITYILLLGPILEERYGSSMLLFMMVVTAFCTGIFYTLLFATGLLGASGIVFMLIILVSIVDMKAGSIPLTFVLVSGIFIGTEVFNALQADTNISHTAHIIGGAIGACFGFLYSKPSRRARQTFKLPKILQ
jgi:membrane associated rhomboid family serine protease